MECSLILKVVQTRGNNMKFAQFLAKEQSAFINCDLTLFIRLLEVAREEIKTDADLHRIVERCSERYAAKGSPLTMDDYDIIYPSDNSH